MSHSPSNMADFLWAHEDENLAPPVAVDGDYTPTVVDGDYTPTVRDGDYTPTVLESDHESDESESAIVETQIDPIVESVPIVMEIDTLVDLTDDDDPFCHLGSYMPPMEGDIHVRRSRPPPTAPVSVPDVLSRMPVTKSFADEMLSFREAAAAQFTRESDDVVWKHMLSASGNLWGDIMLACGEDNHTILLNHCKDKIHSQLMRHPLNFYIGVTHCPLWRWSNEEFGHVFSHWGFQCMWVLLKARVDQTRAIETSLSDVIFGHNPRKLNAEKTPPGALVPDQHGNHYLYVCWAIS